MAGLKWGGKPIISYRNKKHIIIIGLIIGLSSLLFTNKMASRLREKEQLEVGLWAHVFSKTFVGNIDVRDPIWNYINNNIPFIITDENLRVVNSHLIPKHIVNSPALLRRKLEKLSQSNKEIIMYTPVGNFYLFYDKSGLQRSLTYFPYIQLSIIGIFIIFSFITFSSTKQDEQNRIWIGMAKETAHQLGTPTSSLLGWVEYLKSQNVDPLVIEEMNKDLTRLLKIVDRFSKIGSATSFTERDITEVVAGTVDYFRSRIPKNVELIYIRPEAHYYAMVNDALFEWVIENLLKNALDALQGKGKIIVTIAEENPWINIDVRDTGKGMTKANFKRIFEPGFTTKTRGWGLGLSLSRRIVEENHKGRIYVLDSEIDKGTTMRVSLKSSAYSDLKHNNRFLDSLKLPFKREIQG